MKIINKIKNFCSSNLAFLTIAGITILCTMFLITGTKAENGSITLDGQNAKIEEYTEKFIENANDALYRLMNEDAPTDDALVEEYKNGFEGDEGLGGSATLDAVKARRRADGDNDGGRGWQCSKYTAYLATGKKDYSAANPSYGPVNGKNIVEWLVKNFGWKYTDNPVEGAIGAGGFNTLYGHTAEFLYWTGANTAMVNDANYVPLTVSTHSIDVSGWVWAVPGDYEPDNTIPSDSNASTSQNTTPTNAVATNDCKLINVTAGDTMGAIMRRCEGSVTYGETMNNYARTWYSTVVKPGQSVYDGWVSSSGVGLYAGDTIEHKGTE